MKVILVYKPDEPIKGIQQNIIPNGLLYISAFLLKNGIDSEVLNLYRQGVDVILDRFPNIVGISCFTFNRHACLELARQLKEKQKDIKIVFGGPHSTIMYRQLLDLDFIDAIVLGEGEETFLELVKACKKGDPLDNVKGIAYKRQGRIIDNGPREPVQDLDTLPFPAQFFKYKRLMTSRGCPGKCIFCDSPVLWGCKVRLRSAKNVVDEIELLQKKYGLNSFIISDDTFTFSKERTIEICKEIIKRGLKITWDCRSRVNYICEERLRWMKRAGCSIISYGVESGSPKILQGLKKGFNLDQVKQAARITRNCGIALNFYLIVGSPGETDDTIRETMTLIEETKPTSIFTFIMQLTPGTELYERSKSKGIITDDIWQENKSGSIFYTKEKTLPELARYLRLMNELHRVLRKHFDFTQDFIQKLEELNSNDYVNLAQLAFNGDNNVDCDKFLAHAFDLNPFSSVAWMIKGVLLAKKNDPACIDCFNQSIKSDYENILCYKNLFLYLQKQKRHVDAIDIARQAICIEPADHELYKSLAYSLKKTQDFPAAIEALKHCLVICPGDQEAINDLRALQLTTPSSL